MATNLTPLDIQQQKFRTKLRGFDIQEVDLFLDQMADAFEALLKENEKLSSVAESFGTVCNSSPDRPCRQKVDHAH